eukprot:COSAG01_NODE_2253_length_8073_cov_14.930524_4_plen_61_part_00
MYDLRTGVPIWQAGKGPPAHVAEHTAGDVVRVQRLPPERPPSVLWVCVRRMWNQAWGATA